MSEKEFPLAYVAMPGLALLEVNFLLLMASLLSLLLWMSMLLRNHP